VYELEDKLKQTKLDKKRVSNINKKDIGYSLKGDKVLCPNCGQVLINNTKTKRNSVKLD